MARDNDWMLEYQRRRMREAEERVTQESVVREVERNTLIDNVLREALQERLTPSWAVTRASGTGTYTNVVTNSDREVYIALDPTGSVPLRRQAVTSIGDKFSWLQ